MVKDRETKEPLLSKWWKTKSCRDAMKRAKAKKQESLQRFLKAHREQQEALHREIWGEPEETRQSNGNGILVARHGIKRQPVYWLNKR